MSGGAFTGCPEWLEQRSRLTNLEPEGVGNSIVPPAACCPTANKSP
jgi:hypothetical protein